MADKITFEQGTPKDQPEVFRLVSAIHDVIAGHGAYDVINALVIVVAQVAERCPDPMEVQATIADAVRANVITTLEARDKRSS